MADEEFDYMSEAISDVVLDSVIHSVGEERATEVCQTLIKAMVKSSRDIESFNQKIADLMPDLTLAELVLFVDFTHHVEGDIH